MMTAKKPMTFKQALKEAVKRFGKNAVVSYNPKALTEAEKVEVREQLKVMPTEKSLHDELRAARRKLKDATEADKPELLELVRGIETDLKNRRNVAGQLYGDRCRVGIYSELIPGFPINTIQACGDTWEEVFAKCEKK